MPGFPVIQNIPDGPVLRIHGAGIKASPGPKPQATALSVRFLREQLFPQTLPSIISVQLPLAIATLLDAADELGSGQGYKTVVSVASASCGLGAGSAAVGNPRRRRCRTVGADSAPPPHSARCRSCSRAAHCPGVIAGRLGIGESCQRGRSLRCACPCSAPLRTRRVLTQGELLPKAISPNQSPEDLHETARGNDSDQQSQLQAGCTRSGVRVWEEKMQPQPGSSA